MVDIALRGLTPQLHRTLKEAAEQNHRSLNGEILSRLEASVRRAAVDVDTLLARVAERRGRSNVPPMSPDVLRQLKEEGRP